MISLISLISIPLTIAGDITSAPVNGDSSDNRILLMKSSTFWILIMVSAIVGPAAPPWVSALVAWTNWPKASAELIILLNKIPAATCFL